MSRWRIILTSIRRPPRPKRDTPKSRYYRHIREGSTDLGAAQLTADSYDLPVFQVDSDGDPIISKPIRWTLTEIEHVLWMRWLADRGRTGGRDDGAGRYPRLAE